jgi:ribosomal protein S18 acetylase RimI-like enzyme
MKDGLHGRGGGVDSTEIHMSAVTDPADAQELRERLHSFNMQVTGFDDGADLSSFLRDDSGRLIAGLDGFSWGGYARIDYLWVLPDRRGQGLGRALVIAAVNEARARGCVSVIVDTHSFQAPGFYEALGFVEVGRTADTPVGYHQMLYQRRLEDEAS